jgi:uncharacterized protein YdhG (YjbR/CyaY superfamily)
VAARVETVEEYLASFPPEVADVLERVRATVLAEVPEAGERISYQIPAVTMVGRPLVHWAGWARHVSMYPVPDGDDDFRRLLAPYLSGRSTIRLPLRDPFPYDVVAAVARRHVELRRDTEG